MASIYQYISEHLTNGELPPDFSLPALTEDKNAIRFADGAQDGIALYHMGMPGTEEDEFRLMEEALKYAGAHEFAKADGCFRELGEKKQAIFLIDDLQTCLLEHKDELDPNCLFEYALTAVRTSNRRESVKFGLSILELFVTDRDESVKNVIRTVGLSDEFTLFALFVMRQWENGNDEIFRLAQKVHGWGRIHAVERIEPETEEIRRWLLTDAVHNDVLASYNALPCWKKSGAETVLANHPSYEEFAGIRNILDGLLDEGPVRGISVLENKEEIIGMFLKEAQNMPLGSRDYSVIRSIRDAFKENAEIVDACDHLLAQEEKPGD